MARGEPEQGPLKHGVESKAILFRSKAGSVLGVGSGPQRGRCEPKVRTALQSKQLSSSPHSASKCLDEP